jgi:hypothetical protein
LGRRIKTTIIFCQNNTRDANKKPTKKSKSERKSTMEYKLGKITKGRVFTKPIVPQNLSVILHNKVMCMEQIFQDISKQMLEITYTLRLGQPLKITPNFKKYMW